MRDLLILLLATALTALTKLVNRTIDDEYGDIYTGLMPEYEPVIEWAQGATCTGCGIHSTTSPLGVVDVHRVHNGTWHDSTYHNGEPITNITVKFTGHAVYVFNMIANTVPSTSTLTVLDFVLDGVYVDKFTHIPDSSADVLYDVPVYVNSTLMHGPHTLVIAAASDSFVSLTLFDYIVYTVDDSLEASSLVSSPLSLSAVNGFPSYPFSKTTAPRPVAPTDSPSSSSSSTSSASSSSSSSSLWPSFWSPSSSSESLAPTDTSTTSRSRADTSPSHARLGVILGCVVGSIVTAILLTIVFRCRRKRMASAQDANGELTHATSRASHETLPLSDRLEESCCTSSPQAVAPTSITERPQSEHRDRELPPRHRFRNIWRSNTAATFHAEIVALRNEVAMLRADGLGVQRRLDTPPPRYEPPRSRRVLKLGA